MIAYFSGEKPFSCKPGISKQTSIKLLAIPAGGQRPPTMLQENHGVNYHELWLDPDYCQPLKEAGET